jgi:hypothetical protein
MIWKRYVEWSSVLRPVASHRSIENRSQSRNHLCPSHPYIVHVPLSLPISRVSFTFVNMEFLASMVAPVSVLWTSVVCLWSFCKYRVLPLRHGFTLFFWIQRFIVPCLGYISHPLYVVVFSRTPLQSYYSVNSKIQLYRLYIFQNRTLGHHTRASKCVFKHTTLTIQRYLLDHFRDVFHRV